jgi:KRAB domain-containing zinc finger protein
MVKMYFDNHECVGKVENKTHKPENGVNCDRCAGTFLSQDEFVCHQFLGCRETQVPYCAKCDKTFATKTKLKQHDTQAHVEKPKRFVCDICGRGYIDKAHYAKHKASHGTERNFKCPYPGCKAAFKHATILKGHLLVHDKKMDYECYLCKKRFAFYASIKRHIFTHAESSEFRKYACKLCGKRLATSSAYSKHLIFHSGEKSVQCKACPKMFLDLSNMTRHYRTFHEGKSKKA